MQMVATLALTAACSGGGHRDQVYGAATARLGESLAVLGWNTSVSNLRWQDDYVLIDVDAAPTDAAKAHADARDIRFGLYGALAHPMEAGYQRLRWREKPCHPVTFRARRQTADRHGVPGPDAGS
jgi:hypothetical protein